MAAFQVSLICSEGWVGLPMKALMTSMVELHIEAAAERGNVHLRDNGGAAESPAAMDAMFHRTVREVVQ
jgi:hypothetical protein